MLIKSEKNREVSLGEFKKRKKAWEEQINTKNKIVSDKIKYKSYNVQVI